MQSQKLQIAQKKASEAVPETPRVMVWHLRMVTKMEVGEPKQLQRFDCG